MYMFFQGCAKIARQLLNSGASLNCLTEDGMSALHCAVHVRNCVSSPEVEKRCREVMNELLSWYVQPNCCDFPAFFTNKAFMNQNFVQICFNL